MENSIIKIENNTEVNLKNSYYWNFSMERKKEVAHFIKYFHRKIHDNIGQQKLNYKCTYKHSLKPGQFRRKVIPRIVIS